MMIKEDADWQDSLEKMEQISLGTREWYTGTNVSHFPAHFPAFLSQN